MIFKEPKWKSYLITTSAPLLTHEQCNDVIKIGQNLNLKDAQVGFGSKGVVDLKKRKTKVSFIPFDKIPPLYNKINECVSQINNDFFGFDGIQIAEEAQYTEYPKGGYYHWHTDSTINGAVSPFVRKISMTLLLSDEKEFSGGDLEITGAGKILMKRGHAVFFASFLAHRVHPVKKGNRKSLVMWFNGPSLK